MTSLFFRLAGIAGLSSLLVGLGGGAVERPVVGHSALGTFGERTAAYAALHRKIAQTLPPLEAAENLHALYRTQAKLASGIRAASPHAQQGDIFTPAVAEIFRSTIATALSGVDTDAFLRDLYEDQEAVPGFRPHVYDSYPRWATHEVPIVLLLRLPLLPEEIEYRLIDHSLILWDVDANLIIDVLPDAIPWPTS